MTLLALDSSTMSSSIALVKDNDFVVEYNLNLKITHSERLLPQIKKILTEAKIDLKDLTTLAVAAGPGSFTGLRIGFATMKGLSYSLKIPLIGISTLDALAMNFAYSKHLVCPIIDARKGEIYTSLFYFKGGKKFKKLLPELAIKPKEFCHLLKNKHLADGQSIIFFGNGASLYQNIFKKAFKNKTILGERDFVFHRATNLAFLAKQKLKAGEIKKLAKLVPHYIRLSEAELKEKKGLSQK